MRKFDDFIASLDGRRPPRRVMAFNSTNNHELDNTLIEPHRDIYLVEFYWQQLQQNGLLGYFQTFLVSGSKVGAGGSPVLTTTDDDGYKASKSGQVYIIYVKVTSYMHT